MYISTRYRRRRRGSENNLRVTRNLQDICTSVWSRVVTDASLDHL